MLLLPIIKINFSFADHIPNIGIGFIFLANLIANGLLFIVLFSEVRQLRIRINWTEFKPIRELKRAVPENDDCPICLETQLTEYAWSKTHSRWNMCSENEQAIVTACNHRFCQPCWQLHLGSNVRRDHAGVYISCPMCRRRLNHVR